MDFFRNLEIGELFAAVGLDFGFGRLLAQHDGGFHFFAQRGVRDAEADSLADSGMAQQRFAVDLQADRFFRRRG